MGSHFYSMDMDLEKKKGDPFVINYDLIIIIISSLLNAIIIWIF